MARAQDAIEEYSRGCDCAEREVPQHRVCNVVRAMTARFTCPGEKKMGFSSGAIGWAKYSRIQDRFGAKHPGMAESTAATTAKPPGISESTAATTAVSMGWSKDLVIGRLSCRPQRGASPPGETLWWEAQRTTCERAAAGDRLSQL